ncbi:glycosyltransferase family 2 protein [Phaeobacter sp. B1627]|uniref:glycosyltransferase family 2 protein n=1 Tax=Phaeobacter sp. B1627 TaxID=2583809 RepID=UPI00111AA610|nr:glycosyltransferase family 2 protein [Phaeobacter sp. B1627]TNJ42072.1 glycosyltransferase family 2 protein [Phaeobacter sp. B1627]
MSAALSVLIPAHNEADYITRCLHALFASAPHMADVRVEVLVLANGCSDSTAATARMAKCPKHWNLRVLERDQGSKPGALNQGDAAATGRILVYLDADVVVEPDLLPQLFAALDRATACYATGTPVVARAQSAITRSYASVWSQLPFVRSGAPGFGLFAMSRPGRERWGPWPDIISDDTFARLHFTPAERLRLPARYHWPMVEGFQNLVRVRRRQNRGVREVADLFPALLENDDGHRLTLSRVLALALRFPAGMLVYLAVALAVKTPLFRTRENWARGR